LSKPPSQSDNFGGGIPIGDGGSPPHGIGEPPGGGSGPFGKRWWTSRQRLTPKWKWTPKWWRTSKRRQRQISSWRRKCAFGFPWSSSPWNPQYPLWYPLPTPTDSFINKIIIIPNLFYWDRFEYSCSNVS